jgi:hypothetical protein
MLFQYLLFCGSEFNTGVLCRVVFGSYKFVEIVVGLSSRQKCLFFIEKRLNCNEFHFVLLVEGEPWPFDLADLDTALPFSFRALFAFFFESTAATGCALAGYIN